MMFRNLNTRIKMLLGFSIPIFLMIIVAYMVFTNFRATIETSAWVQHTHEVISHANGLGKSIVDMETGERGFLITGRDEFLEPFETSQRKWRRQVDQIVELVSDNMDQVKRVKTIDELQIEWLKVAAGPEFKKRRLVQDGKANIADVAALIESEKGKRIIDSIRKNLDDLIEAETKLMKT